MRRRNRPTAAAYSLQAPRDRIRRHARSRLPLRRTAPVRHARDDRVKPLERLPPRQSRGRAHRRHWKRRAPPHRGSPALALRPQARSWSLRARKSECRRACVQPWWVAVQLVRALQTSAEPATVQPLGASVIALMRYTVSPAASSASVTDEAWLSATTPAMPTPQFKVSAISPGDRKSVVWGKSVSGRVE